MCRLSLLVLANLLFVGTAAAAEDLAESAEAAHGHHAHAGHDVLPGAQMLYKPAFGEHIYHTHPEGTWMVGYKFMRVSMNGLRDGTSDVPVENVSPVGSTPYGYMVTPTRMTMDMNMLMAMYGLSDRLTLMAMANYQSNSMDMLMNMGMGNVPQPAMKTSGFGDTELTGIYKIANSLMGSLGLGIPTGSIDKRMSMMGMTFRAPYDMQLGSGTWDIKPSLTYDHVGDDAKWNCGAQASYNYHIGKNKHDYSLGDSIKLTGWLQRALGPATSWLRLAFADTGRIRGRDGEIAKILVDAPMPDADPRNYGGQRLDGLIGVSHQKGSFSIGVEGGVPLYQNLNGLQLKTKWFLTAGVQIRL